MFIKRLRVTDFRCFERLDVEPAPGINIVVGDNASGKSALLEAIFFLGRGRSFRRSPPPQSIRHGSTRFTVWAEIGGEHGEHHRLGIQRWQNKIEYRRDGERDVDRLDLVNTLPVQLIDPNIHRLLEQGPGYRRRFMDWGVFHVEHAFFPAWRRYRRALKQRNRALKARAPKKDIVAWDAEMVHQAEIVDASRRAYIDHLDCRLPDSARQLLSEEPITLTYQPGWRGTQGFGAALAGSLERDQKLGFTQQGPHRADLKVQVASAIARDWVSRGQQKLLTTAMLLVQAEILETRRGIRPVLLIDDLAAEMGTAYRETLGREIRAFQGQSFLTFLDAAAIPQSMKGAPMFHVEHGAVVPMGQ